MTKRDERDAEPLVVVARGVKTRGLKGEIVADLLTDFPDRFAETETLIAVSADGAREPLTLENHWFQKNRVVLKFAGYDTVEAANELVSRDFGVPESERVPLEGGSFYQWELEGCDVKTVSGQSIGKVQKVLETGGVEILVITDGDREFLVPMAESIVIEIDVANKRMVLDPPEGLLEL